MTVSGKDLFTLREAAGQIGLDGYRENYSGRGMYGDQCIGIVGTPMVLLDYVLAVADMDRALADRLVSVSTDNMASEFIYYWPSLKMGEEMGE